MEQLEQQIREYRARQRKKALVDSVKNTFNIFSFRPFKKMVKKDEKEPEPENKPTPKKITNEKNIRSANPTREFNPENEEVEEKFTCNWISIFVKTCIWACLFSVAVFVEFGFVFVLLTGFYLIWVNMRTGPKRPNEISAYSVFNPNCEKIDGTLDADQFEREIRYGGIL